MKKIKLHQWYALAFFASVLLTACSKKAFMLNTSTRTEENYENTITDSLYTPPAVILVPDDKAKTNKDDELYYVDELGYRYWRYSDGKYYLDQKYAKSISLKKKQKPAITAKLTTPQR